VTLHHLMDTVELKDVGVRTEGLYRFAGAMATRMCCCRTPSLLLMPGYRKILNDKYAGTMSTCARMAFLRADRNSPIFPGAASRPPHSCFGKWGTYKRLELMIEALI